MFTISKGNIEGKCSRAKRTGDYSPILYHKTTGRVLTCSEVDSGNINLSAQQSGHISGCFCFVEVRARLS